MNLLKIVLLQFSDTYMLLMDYPYIGEEEITDNDKKATWKVLHAYIDANSQRLIDKCSVEGAQSISIFQSQCTNIIFAEKIIYNIIFQQVMHKVEE